MSCAPLTTGDPRAVAKPGDPALDGKDYLLSETQFRALLPVARAYVAQRLPQYFLHRIHVVSATQVEIYLGPFDEYGSDPYVLYGERAADGWHITGGGEMVHLD